MNYESYKADYDRDGYVIVRNFLVGEELDALQANIDRYIREVVPALPDAHAFYEDKSRPETLKQMHHMSIDPFFRQYVDHPQWRRLAEAMIGETAKSEEPEWFNKPPGSNHPTPPHQDNYYFCLEPPHVATIWVALDDVDEENGCLRYVPGSHLKPVRSHTSSQVIGFSQGIPDYGTEDREAEVLIELAPGDAVIHHGNLIHRAEANQSTVRHRRAFAQVFKGASCRRDEAAFERYRAALKQQQEAAGLRT